VVTAVIVAHDGAEWLHRVTDAVLGQTRPVQRIVAVDTGSRDRSGTLLADLLGHEVVFGMDRDTGYGAAVARALTHRAATLPVAAADDWADAGGEPVEWIWLVHDDCEPEPDCLEQLLRGATQTPGAAVFGPKVLDWSDRQVILEAGLAIDTAGRRVSGTEPREIDQGQHDGDRDVLAVSSVGMLARRDVWDEIGGFDTSLRLFREDVDFCWRVHAAGYRVQVITEAVVYHLEASARGRRQISAVERPRSVDRRNALIVLLANLPLSAMLTAAAGNAGLSAARILFFLLGKRAEAARDEAAAFGYLLAHPGRLIAARRRRRRLGRRRAYGALRSQVPRGRSLHKLAEFVAATLYPSSRAEAVGSHHASDDPSDDESLLTDSGIVQRFLTNPGVLLFTALLLVALIAERSLLGSGPLGGGALLPSWGGASALWGEYLTGFHAVGIGSASSTPPYVAVIATLSTILAGKPWLAVEVLLLGCVPLSGLAAYLASRQVSQHSLVRVWLAASYALLPVATGAIAAGRLGTAVVFILVPLIASAAGRMLTRRRRQARRAAWATGLLIAVAAAFVPLVWVVAVVVAAFAGLAFARTRRATAINLAIVALVPPVLLAPWTLDVAGHPAMLLLEAGLQRPGLASRNLPASSLLLLNPGGPGTPPVWVAGGLVLAGLAALLMRRRGFDVAAAWGVALSGLLTAIAVSRFVVSPPDGGPAVPAWPGVALIFAAAGLLLAVAAVGGDLYRQFAAGGLRRLGALAVAAVAAASPVLAAVFWVAHGVPGPVTRIASPVLPEFVSISSAGGARLRTLVLRPDGSSVNYTVLRGGDPPLGAGELSEPGGASSGLSHLVAALTAPGGTGTGDLGAALASFDIGYVLLPAPIDQGLARQIDAVVGLRPVSQTASFELWKVAETVARVRVTEPGGTQVALPSGTMNVSNAAAPAAGGTLVLAEPASGSWHATLNGHPLTPLASPVDGWAQGFQLPSGGGRLSITRDETGRTIVLALELIALLVVAALALPGTKEPAAAAEAAGAAGGTRRSSHATGAARSGGTRSAGADSRSSRGGGRRGVRGRDVKPAAGAGRGTRGTRAPGRRRRTGADGTEPNRAMSTEAAPWEAREEPPGERVAPVGSSRAGGRRRRTGADGTGPNRAMPTEAPPWEPGEDSPDERVAPVGSSRAGGRRRRTGADGSGPNRAMAPEALPGEPTWESPGEPMTRADSPWAEPVGPEGRAWAEPVEPADRSWAEPVGPDDSPWSEPGLDDLPPDRAGSGDTMAQYALPHDGGDYRPPGDARWAADEDADWARDEQVGWSSGGPVSGARETDW
jgi:GT2 family glycosyltransferase